MSNQTSNAIGEAVFIRTDVPQYLEAKKSFRTLDEMIDICTTTYPKETLEKIVVFASKGGQPVTLTLGFIASSRGRELPAALREAMKMLPRR
jgi:hypothetical protein